MPLLDVSIALTSPHLVDSFLITRRPETVSGQGLSSVSTTTIPAYGIVVPDGDNKLSRKEDAADQSRSIEVIAQAQYSLRGACKGFQPDLVTWRGNQYVVADVRDNTNYGPGFVKVTCVMEELLPIPPEAV